jgi:IPTL-CTERM motif
MEGARWLLAEAIPAVPTLGEWGVAFLILAIITTAWIFARGQRSRQR